MASHEINLSAVLATNLSVDLTEDWESQWISQPQLRRCGHVTLAMTRGDERGRGECSTCDFSDAQKWALEHVSNATARSNILSLKGGGSS